MRHQLLAIVAVEKEHRVQWLQPGCGRGVYSRIHVVDKNGKLLTRCKKGSRIDGDPLTIQDFGFALGSK